MGEVVVRTDSSTQGSRYKSLFNPLIRNQTIGFGVNVGLPIQQERVASVFPTK